MNPIRIMFDIETLSTRPDASVLSIGAVVFGSVGDLLTAAPPSYPREFYVNVHDPEGHVDLDTALWWLDQTKKAQQRLLSDRKPLVEALNSFYLWCSRHITGDDLALQSQKTGFEFWARSPSFDEVILTNAFRRGKVKPPFHYRASRDCRTIESLAGYSFDGSLTSVGCAHDALSDALAQAAHTAQCMARLRQGDVP